MAVVRSATTPIGGRLVYDKSPGVFTIAHNYAQDNSGLALNNGVANGQVPAWLAEEFGGKYLWGNYDYATRQQTPYLLNPDGSGLMWFNQDWANTSQGVRPKPNYEVKADTSPGGTKGFKNLDAATNTIDEHLYRTVDADGNLVSQSSSSTNDPWAKQQTVAGATLGSGNPFWQNFNVADVAKNQTVHTTVLPRPQAPQPQSQGPQKVYGKPELRSGGWVRPVEWLYPDGGRVLIEMEKLSGPVAQPEPAQGPQVQAIPGIQSGVGGPFGPMPGTWGAPINAGTPYAGIAVPNVEVMPGTWGAPPPSSSMYVGGNVVSSTPTPGASQEVTGQILPKGYSASPYDSNGILKAIDPTVGRAPTDTEWQKIYVDLARAKRDYWQNLQQQRAPGSDLQLWMAENVLRQWEQMNPSQVATIRFGEQGFAPLLDEMAKWGTGGIDPAVMDYFAARAQSVPNLPQGSLAGGTGTLTQNTSLFGGNWGYVSPDSAIAMGWATPESQGRLPVESLPGMEAEQEVSGQIIGPWKGGSTFTAPTPGVLQDWNGGPTGVIGSAPTTSWAPNYYGSNNGDGFSVTPGGAVIYGPGSLPSQSGTENTLSGMPGYNPETMWHNLGGALPNLGRIDNPFGYTGGQPLDVRAPGAPGSYQYQAPSGWIEQGQVQFPSLMTPHTEVTGGVLQAGNLGGATGSFAPPPALQANSTGWTTNAGNLIPSAGSAHPSYDPLAADSTGWAPTVQPQSFPSWAEAQYASGQTFPMPVAPMYQSK